MMKRIISLLLTLTLVLSCALVFASCGNGETKTEEGTISRIVLTVVNAEVPETASCDGTAQFESLSETEAVPDDLPCVELLVDENNVVLSVTALNDDGAVLIVGEDDLVGADSGSAVGQIVSLCVTTGYIPADDGNGGEYSLTVSVSGDDACAKKLQNASEKVASTILASFDHVKAKVETAKAAHIDVLRNELIEKSICTEEEADALTENEIYSLLAADRIETAQLYTAAMKEAYYSAKDYKISLAEREETAAIIQSMGGLYALFATAYSTALDQYGAVIDQLDAARYDYLVSPESAYQKSITALYEARAELVAERKVCASLTVGTESYTAELATLQLREEDFNAALQTYIDLGNQLDSALQSLISSLRQFEAALEEIESNMPSDFTEALNAGAAEIDEALNAVKDGFFAEFEAAHADDIAAMEAQLQARKEQLQTASGVKVGE